MSETFGYAEAKEFCEAHSDPRVKVLWKWLCECRSKNAMWADALEKANRMIDGYIMSETEAEALRGDTPRSTIKGSPLPSRREIP